MSYDSVSRMVPVYSQLLYNWLIQLKNLLHKYKSGEIFGHRTHFAQRGKIFLKGKNSSQNVGHMGNRENFV